jgi:hypothetical protein
MWPWSTIRALKSQNYRLGVELELEVQLSSRLGDQKNQLLAEKGTLQARLREADETYNRAMAEKAALYKRLDEVCANNAHLQARIALLERGPVRDNYGRFAKVAAHG